MKRIYTKHGMTGTKIHGVWKEMHRRCKGKYAKTRSYKAKGIKVCDEWSSAKSFIEWAMSNGYNEGLQLDRIDNDGGYSPKNCRFVTPKENANNRSNTVRITFDGKTKTLDDWSKLTGIGSHTIYTRIKRGWSTKRSLTQKVQERTK